MCVSAPDRKMNMSFSKISAFLIISILILNSSVDCFSNPKFSKYLSKFYPNSNSNKERALITVNNGKLNLFFFQSYSPNKTEFKLIKRFMLNYRDRFWLSAFHFCLQRQCANNLRMLRLLQFKRTLYYLVITVRDQPMLPEIWTWFTGL